jgi:hypothetical protein
MDVPASIPLDQPTRLDARSLWETWNPWAVWQRLDTGWKLALSLLVAQRVVLGAIAFISVLTAPNLRLAGDPWPVLAIRGGEPWSLVLTTWHHWDAIRYYDLAEHGYGAGRGGLYPLFPLAARALSIPLGGQLLGAELIVSSAAFAVAMRLIYDLVHLEGAALARVLTWTRGRKELVEDPARREQLARLAVLLVALFPTGFFFFAPYTESLFLATTVASVWYARRGLWWLAGLSGMLAALTRFPGAFLALALAFEYARQRGVLTWLRGQGGAAPRFDLFATLLPLVGMALVPLSQIIARSGNTQVWLLQAARFWGERLDGQRPSESTLGSFDYRVVPPWNTLADSWSYVLGWTANPPASLPIVELFNLICMLGFCALGVLALRRLPLMYSLYVWPSLVLLLTREMGFSPLMSVSRYVLVIFPCFLVLAQVLVDHRRLTAAWLIGGAGLQGLLLWFHSRIGFVA